MMLLFCNTSYLQQAQVTVTVNLPFETVYTCHVAIERPLARGHTAHIFDIQQGAHPRFPEATLIRKEPTTPHRESGALTFSLHQVAHALFPQHFARMYGYETITHGPEVMVEAGGMLDYRPIHVFYMEKLPILADHFIYTNHTRPNSRGAKENYCQCPQCTGH